MRKLYLTIFFSLLFAFLIALYGLPELLVGERTLPNLFLEGINVGNLNPEELKTKIEEIVNDYEKSEIKFVYQDSYKKLALKDLGVTPLQENTFSQIKDFGKTGFIFKRWYYMLYALRNRTYFELEKSFNREQAYKELFDFTQKFAVKPQDAKLIISDNDEVTIVKGVTGKQADISNTIQQLENIINSGRKLENLEIQIAEVTVNPEVTEQDLRNLRITGKIAEVTTYFNAANKERTHNIKIASDKLQEYMVPPGAVFSFNEAVGPRTKEAGYKDAMIIVENEFEPGLGGGICQVSSTVYIAALKANLEIVERRRHSLLVDYVPPGLDATVVYGFIDFKFKNNTGGHILIKPVFNKNSLTIKIFGWDENAPQVNITRSQTLLEPPVEVIEDPSLAAGEEIVVEKGKVGYKVQVVRRVKDKNGKTLAQEVISSDTYHPQKKVVRLGTGNIEVPEQEEKIEQEEPIQDAPQQNELEENEDS